MKKILLILNILLSISVMAQDVIIKRNGDELQCKIVEVSKNEVKYKRWSNQEGPMFAEKKTDIFMIKYENGEKDVMQRNNSGLEMQNETESNISNSSSLINENSRLNEISKETKVSNSGFGKKIKHDVTEHHNEKPNSVNFNHRSRKIVSKY